MSTIPLNDTTPRVQYSASAGQTVFIYPFWATNTSDLNVYVDGTQLVPVTEFTASDLLSPTGGNITLTSPTTEGQLVTIERNIPFERVSEFQEGGTFKASILNLEFSKLLAMMQQLKRDIGRKIGPSPTSTAEGLVMPEPIDGRAIVFDGIEGALRTSVVPVDDIDSAIVSAQNAAVTATDAAASVVSDAAAAEAAKTAAEDARDEAVASIGLSKVTALDTTPAPLDSKLAAGQLMFKSISNSGADEILAMGVAIADEATAIAGASNAVAITPLANHQHFMANLDAELNTSGSAPKYVCRAWGSFTGDAGVTIESSGNISSITRLGEGAYAVSFSTNMPDANYVVMCGHGRGISFPNSASSMKIENRTASGFEVYTEVAASTDDDHDLLMFSVLR